MAESITKFVALYRVTDVLSFLGLKVIDVLNLLGHRCAEPYQVATRQQILQTIASQKALMLAFHFPFPGLGYIDAKGDGWQWQPVETAG